MRRMCKGRAWAWVESQVPTTVETDILRRVLYGCPFLEELLSLGADSASRTVAGAAPLHTAPPCGREGFRNPTLLSNLCLLASFGLEA